MLVRGRVLRDRRVGKRKGWRGEVNVEGDVRVEGGKGRYRGRLPPDDGVLCGATDAFYSPEIVRAVQLLQEGVCLAWISEIMNARKFGSAGDDGDGTYQGP